MPHYLMSVYGTHNDVPPPPEVMEEMFRDVDVFNQDLKRNGNWVFGGGLHPPATATVVRVQDGETITTDGPFAETKEQIGGFWIITAADLDEALALAARGSVACRWPVEVRPFQEDVG